VQICTIKNFEIMETEQRYSVYKLNYKGEFEKILSTKYDTVLQVYKEVPDKRYKIISDN